MSKEDFKQKRREGGITLISLVITVIVLLILAGVTINLTLGDNGIFRVAEQVSRNYKNAEQQELGALDQFNEELETIIDFEKLKEFDVTKGVNKPKVADTGLIPVTINSDGSLNTVTDEALAWYSYDGTTNNWANAKTADESMWVWIPRYAYKINYTNPSDKSAGGTIDVVFLKGITNLDANGNDVTSASYVDANGNTGAYIVHPAFKDGSVNGFANGEWDEEITGFWVAKFEAGYAGEAGDATSAQDSEATIMLLDQWNGSVTDNLLTNYYGTRAVGDAIKYPVFQACRPSMNNIGISDSYDLCRSLCVENNPYKLKNIDSHLVKNSEWGAIAYLTHSKYGRNGQEILINNVSVENENTIYAVTGYASETTSSGRDLSRDLETLMSSNQSGSWTTEQGKTASTTGNIYGIYDMSGGLWEFVAGYITIGERYETYAGSLKGESTKYKSKYAGISNSAENYLESVNSIRKGEAIWETSTSGRNYTSWNNDRSAFCYAKEPFMLRSSGWGNGRQAGIFFFGPGFGCASYDVGFRAILIAE